MNQREASKNNWESRATVEDINSGSLQRIADATEKMASNYTNLQNELHRYQQWYKEESLRVKQLYKKISSMQGQITKLKNKLSATLSM